VREVFLAFLKLGLTSFGGPIAHLGYFRREFVERRRWLDESAFAQLLAITQFLPGPASSQLGFSIGLLRAGWGGAIAAFLAFTLPSAVLLFAFAMFWPRLGGAPIAVGVLHGLKLVALAVVANGLVGMARRLTPDVTRVAIAAAAAALCLVYRGAGTQIEVVALGAVAGFFFCREAAPTGAERLQVAPNLVEARRWSWAFFTAFALVLAGLVFAARAYGGIAALADGFYRVGALVFGGGHVVLPLLQETVVRRGWVSPDAFLAGYGAAQAVPGPMFSLAAFLGALASPAAGRPLLGAAIALVAIFLPGFLLLAGTLPLWNSLTSRPGAARAVAGVGAAVVGLLAAALYDPVWVSAVHAPLDAVIAGIGFAALTIWNVSPLLIVLWCVCAATLT
jgi:chromate transporter